jgi:hypothetical protein
MHAGTLAKPYVTHVTYAPSSMAPTDAARSIAHRTLVAFYVYRTYNLISVGPARACPSNPAALAAPVKSGVLAAPSNPAALIAR